MKKIAVACLNDKVCEHFGHCESFNIYETENNEVKSKNKVENPGHEKGFLPKFLGDMGVNVIISGGMGQGAIDLFNERGIEIITGNLGLSDEVVAKYLKGELTSNGSICERHAYKDTCGEHEN